MLGSTDLDGRPVLQHGPDTVGANGAFGVVEPRGEVDPIQSAGDPLRAVLAQQDPRLVVGQDNA